MNSESMFKFTMTKISHKKIKTLKNQYSRIQSRLSDNHHRTQLTTDLRMCRKTGQKLQSKIETFHQGILNLKTIIQLIADNRK